MGVLVDKQIRSLTEGSRPSLVVAPQYIQAASIDLPITNVIRLVAGEPDLSANVTIERFFIKHYQQTRFDLNNFDGKSLTLSPGQTYLAQLDMECHLPSTLSAFANPKSSTGRNAIHCKLICENGKEFDAVPAGYRGKLYLLITPRIFPVNIRQTETLAQLRIVSGKRRFLHGWELEHLHRQSPLIGNTDCEPVFCDEGMMLHLDLTGEPAILVAHDTRRTLPLWERCSQYPGQYFYDKGLDTRGIIHVEPRQFALARTREHVRIPPGYCAEMMPFNPAHGEIRYHDAGFIDPGFGHGRHGELNGSTIVCEITNVGAGAAQLANGRRISILRFERLDDVPDQVYGENSANRSKSHYQGQQGITLAKQFRSWES